MQTALHMDLETRSALDLKKVGVHKYAEHPSTSVICMRYRLGHGPLGRWRHGEPLPDEVVEHIAAGRTVVAHNAAFERIMFNRHMGGSNLQILPSQQNCTLARAAALGLPQQLEKLADVLQTAVRKDKEGHRLMMSMCRPAKVLDDGTLVWRESPEELDRLEAYCGDDVLAECGADEKLPNLSAAEQEVWELDQAINDRGFTVDLELAAKAVQVVKEAQRRADRRIWELTGGAVEACTQVQRIIAWLNERGIVCTSIAKGDVEELVVTAQQRQDAAAEEVLALRRSVAKSSTTKYRTMLDTACADGRIRGTLAYHAAHTGRWGGRGVQPQNFPRVESVDSDFTADDVNSVLALLQSSHPPAAVCDALELLHGRPLDALSKSLRVMIIAPPGRKLIGGDFSNIEGRVNAWLAGELWKLQAFEAYDRGEGPDLYKLTAGRICGKPFDQVTKVERQAQGKVSELACGYQGSVGAYISMGAAYLVRAADVAKVALDQATEEQKLRARLAYDPARGYGLERWVWEGVKIVVDGWRDANPHIVQGWWDLQDAAIDAVANPGVIVPVLKGRVRYLYQDKYLWCMLPSGRVLAYPSAHIRWVDSGRKDVDGKPIMKRQVRYLGVDSQTKKWGVHALYGGMQCNHVVQGTARDILVAAMKRLERRGYWQILSIHDEAVAEVLAWWGSKDEFAATMAEKEPWMAGVPLAVSAWEGPRYGH